MKYFRSQSFALALLLTGCMAGCGGSGSTSTASGTNTEASAPAESQTPVSYLAAEHSTDISSELTYTSSMELSYATCFTVDYYAEGPALITIAQDSQFLLVPEGLQAPADLSDGITVLQQPLDHIYLAASAVMDMFIHLDGMDRLAFTSLKEDAWYLPEARDAVASGAIAYAGKYAAPDYEQLIDGSCDLAIENTMIYHTPEIKEQLERVGIPVLVDYSSYESDPLGRTEWVKLYGLLTGQDDQAASAFAREDDAFAAIRGEETSGSTVAFFYIATNGQVNVRKSSDYMAKMIELAGGSYIFSDLGGDEDTANASMTMTMEEFYAAAKDADYIIYNSTIDGELRSTKDLLAKSDLLSNFKALKEGHVYCTTKNIYQSSMSLGTITADIHYMLEQKDDALTYIYPLS